VKDQRLDHLFREYHEACESPDPSATFMPGLWQKIEKAQSISLAFRRWARSFVAAAAAVSLIGVLAIRLHHDPSGPSSISYLEALVASNSPDTVELLDASHTESWDDVELL